MEVSGFFPDVWLCRGREGRNHKVVLPEIRAH